MKSLKSFSMEDKLLTIFTPTYNRAYSLPPLYKSLVKQKDKRFLWMIVDDGSTDNTSDLIKQWQKERILEIKYIYQENQGKMKAHNKAALLCDTELFVCLDSDDCLAENAVGDVLTFWGEEKTHRDNVIGLISPKIIVNDKGEVIRRPVMPKGLCFATGQGVYKAGYRGETAMFFRTTILKKYPFPVQEGEKFISEIAAYDQIDEKYQYAILDKPTMVCMYRSDGYSNNQLKVYVDNPKGVVYVIQQRNAHIDRFSPTLTKKYIAYSRIAHYSWKRIIANAHDPFWCFLLIPLGLIEKKRIFNALNKKKQNDT